MAPAKESEPLSRPLLIVSNRLPVVVAQEEGGKWSIRPGSGGLVTAMKPVLERLGGCWVGWPGDAHGAPIEDLLGELGGEMGCEFAGVPLTDEQVEGYYYGFSNETLWPLFHDLLGHAKFDRDNWLAYVETNGVFAEEVVKSTRPGHLVWVHDYQLILVGQGLRDRGVTNTLAFFLHIPFPAPDIFARLPWREELLRALLAYDSLGFHTQRDLRNFTACVRTFIPEARTESHRRMSTVSVDGRVIHCGAHPISIDFNQFDSGARAREAEDAAWYLHENHQGKQIILGVDRLDYTKGLFSKFAAFGRALEKYPELQGHTSLVQLVVPSRQDIPEYQRWKERIDQLVGEINGRFARHGWVPLHYMYRSIPEYELLGYYRAAQVCLVTPLRDGMNLVCKEYVAACVEGHGVLVLSEFAGAAAQLKPHALIVNPHDLEGVADAIHRACTMPEEERTERMGALRREVKRHDIYWWVRGFLDSVPRERAAAVAPAG